ncbi:MAG: transposase [Proteobacteria bacterium]|nr:transposase [Pseudomonadota bacterium]
MRAGRRALDAHEFIRRFLVHVLPKGFHRIRHYGLLANGNRADAIATARELLAVACVGKDDAPSGTASDSDPQVLPVPCPRCGSAMFIIETFARGCEPKHRPSPIVIRIDTS